MIINLINKHTLVVDEFQFQCSVGKLGLIKNKMEGDLCTPKGIFKLESLLYRSDRVNPPKTKLKIKKIFKMMCWCNDFRSKYYNKLLQRPEKLTYEKIYRHDHKYDYIIPLNYNRKKIKRNKGSAIFIHLTTNYKPTAGCIALKKKDFEIMIKLIKKNTYIKIN
jgi:L,D-peptidoglycan transpeptidase YkuD (ErfK/YbiS/YcfS/YnhG family)